jgi:hypothetical protein
MPGMAGEDAVRLAIRCEKYGTEYVFLQRQRSSRSRAGVHYPSG